MLYHTRETRQQMKSLSNSIVNTKVLFCMEHLWNARLCHKKFAFFFVKSNLWKGCRQDLVRIFVNGPDEQNNQMRIMQWSVKTWDDWLIMQSEVERIFILVPMRLHCLTRWESHSHVALHLRNTANWAAFCPLRNMKETDVRQGCLFFLWACGESLSRVFLFVRCAYV